MKKEKDRSSEEAELRCLAEERLRAKTAELLPPRTEEETQRLVHELEVHQIELEMQNAELLRTRDAMEKALARYTDLYDFAPVGYFSIDRDGTISRANLTGAGLLGIDRSSLIGRRFGQFVSSDNSALFDDFLRNVVEKQLKDSCRVSLLRKGHEPVFERVETSPCNSGRECRIVVVDITERKRAEDEVWAAKSDAEWYGAEMAVLLDAVPAAVLI